MFEVETGQEGRGASSPATRVCLGVLFFLCLVPCPRTLFQEEDKPPGSSPFNWAEEGPSVSLPADAVWPPPPFLSRGPTAVSGQPCFCSESAPPTTGPHLTGPHQGAPS